MIVGGGATSYYLAKLLSSRNIHVTIIEKDMKRCEELVDALPDVTVDCGDGTDRQLLDEEHLEIWTALWPARASMKLTPSFPFTS